MKKEFDNASEYYHHPDYRYNCAQAMVCHFGGNKEDITGMKLMGSGRAPQGYCGALHGALHLLDKLSLPQKSYIEIFTKETGSPFCRQIRKQRIISCRECVEIADKTLSSFLKQNHINYD